ncbi:MAG: STAS domain-containing protein [Acidobacteria bacterium]|nr:MAG: STAS domain-containing protein [Acidobacteriota bacterium]
MQVSESVGTDRVPVSVVWDGILMVSVFGILDSARAQELMDSMLSMIQRTQARVIILDIIGVTAMDTAVANHVIQITRATQLMGCECIVSGISPAVAQTMVHLGIDLGEVKTVATMAAALETAFGRLGLEVRPREGK